MKHMVIEFLPLTPLEEEAEQELRVNWQSLQKTAKRQRGIRIKRCPVLIEQMPLTAREREAETERDSLELGMPLPL